MPQSIGIIPLTVSLTKYVTLLSSEWQDTSWTSLTGGLLRGHYLDFLPVFSLNILRQNPSGNTEQLILLLIWNTKTAFVFKWDVCCIVFLLTASVLFLFVFLYFWRLFLFMLTVSLCFLPRVFLNLCLNCSCCSLISLDLCMHVMVFEDLWCILFK